MSTTYSSQGKTADRVLADIDSTLSKEGLYVAVSRAKTNLSLYTADKPQLYKRAQRSSAKANPSDYLTLFQLVNPNAENEKAARAARDVRSEARAEHVGDSAGERVEVSHRAAVRRDRQLRQEVSELRAEQADSHRSMSQMLLVWSQELKNAVKPKNSNGKPSALEKQLKVLSTALGSWSRQQQALIDSMNSLSEKLDD